MIRIATEADVPAILEIYAPYVKNTTITFEYDVPGREEFLERFRVITVQFPWLVWEEAGEILGYAYAAPPYTRDAYRWCAEPSIYLKPHARGRGIGRKLYTALEEILKLQGDQVLYALITQENKNSLHFHEKFGYSRKVLFDNCGFKFGRWLGVYWLEKRLIFVEIPKSFPTSFSQLRQNTQRFSDILYSLSLS